MHQKATTPNRLHTIKDETIGVKMVLKRRTDNIHRQTSNIFPLTTDQRYFFLSSVRKRSELSLSKQVNTHIWTFNPFPTGSHMYLQAVFQHLQHFNWSGILNTQENSNWFWVTAECLVLSAHRRRLLWSTHGRKERGGRSAVSRSVDLSSASQVGWRALKRSWVQAESSRSCRHQLG